MWCKVLMFQPIYHVSVSPIDGNGPTQGQRKTLTRVGFEPTTFGFDHRCSTDWATRSDGSWSWEMKMLMARQWICRYKEGLRCISNVWPCVALILRTNRVIECDVKCWCFNPYTMWALALQMEMGPHKDRGKLWPGWELNPRPKLN